ncbi:MAG: hypothetical protein D6780_07825, partial [Candidatus Dadabacteria bacterium]
VRAVFKQPLDIKNIECIKRVNQISSLEKLSIITTTENASAINFFLQSKNLSVFADGRLYLFPPSFWVQYLKVLSGKYSVKFLEEKFHAGVFLLTLSEKNLLKQLTRAKDWQLVYSNKSCFLFKKRNQ